MERKYVDSLVAGCESACYGSSFQFHIDPEEVLSWNDFVQAIVDASFELASKGNCSGDFCIHGYWADRNGKETRPPVFLGVLNGKGFRVETKIKPQALRKGSDGFQDANKMLVKHLKRELDLYVGVSRPPLSSVYIGWIDDEFEEDIQEVLSLPMGYESYCAGVPIEDILA